jgi:membrane associated rhomboid family serine protease
MLDPSSFVPPVSSSGALQPLARAEIETPFVLAPATELLRVSGDPRRLDAWALVLVSRGLSPLVRAADGTFELHVPLFQAALASAVVVAVDRYERVAARARRVEVKRERLPATRHAVLGSSLVALLLLAFFALTGPRSTDSQWFTAGAADAERVLHGEWWRTVTALTLHADAAHVLSNVGIGTFVIGAVMRSEGVGWGAALVLASGSVGNSINAWAHQTLHRSVGFSTAVFGAIGILGGLAYVHARRRAHELRPAWTALAGSLALFALLGTSERSDVLAHLFGGLAGVGLGLLAAWSEWRPKTYGGQWLAGLGAAPVVAGAWLVALT